MNHEYRISPFASEIVFKDVETLVTAFRQKASAEDWPDNIIDATAKEIERAKSLSAAISTMLQYVETIEHADDDNWSPFSEAENDEDAFKGDEDFEIEEEY